jgi:tRNA(His) guanylyltransferase
MKGSQTKEVESSNGSGNGSGNGNGRPKEMSRTQRDKDRKRRTKARIVIEHVDIIKDEFWERRPWILSGNAGV